MGHFANVRLSKKNSNVEKGEGRGRNYIFSIQLLPAWMLYKHPVQHQIHPDICILKIYVYFLDQGLPSRFRAQYNPIHKSNPIQYKCYTRIIHSARAIQCKSLHDSCNKRSPIQSKLLAFFLKASCKKYQLK